MKRPWSGFAFVYLLTAAVLCSYFVTTAEADPLSAKDDFSLGIYPVPLVDEEGDEEYTVDSSYVSKVAVDNGGASMAVWKMRTALRIERFLKLSYEMRHFTWDDVRSLPFDTKGELPWTELHRLGLEFEAGAKLNEQFRIIGRLGGYFSYEDEWRDSGTGALILGADYRPSDEWDLRFGGAVSYGEGLSFTPFGRAKWTQQPQESLNLFPYWFFTIGIPRFELGLRATRMVQFTLYGTRDGGQWRLSNDNNAAPGGTVSTDAYQAGVELKLMPVGELSVRTSVDYSFGRHMTLSDDSTGFEETYAIDPALGFSIRFDYEF